MLKLQKASFGKRIIAAIFDGMLVAVIAVGLAALLSGITNFESYSDKMSSVREKYQDEYKIEKLLSDDEYNELSKTEKADYDEKIKAANNAMSKDKEATNAWNMMITLSMLLITIPTLIAIIIIEFVVPLFFGNGQTLGKKIFGIALMHKDGIKASNVQLFARAVLGKFTLELMLPIYIFLYFGLGDIGTIVLLTFLAVEIICFITSHTNSLLHDTLSNIVAVDMASQRIFETREELVEYTKKLHAEKVKESTY